VKVGRRRAERSERLKGDQRGRVVSRIEEWVGRSRD